jgi:hypothetical protein
MQLVEEIMNKLLTLWCLILATLALAGCFPSERMYVVEDCVIGDPTKKGVCDLMPTGSEFAFVKTNGSNYEIWVNMKPEKKDGPMLVLPCEAPVKHGKFICDICAPDDFRIVKASGSDCGFDKCVKIRLEGGTSSCPDNGTGRGGHN